ncbi:glycosyl transferase family 2 [Candidatus Woesearchaeota archaeon]|nr:glycosyl transferase family 2 [Candidatus Woesearchaeota archaeon]|tara:strand:+ start:24354 stop:25235 length:882 start_codon:yes stop_codon:yes gene_type:complete
MKLVVTIPAYNEEKTIASIIKRIFTVAKKLKHKSEVIVVNDGSTDRTAEVAKKAGATVYSHPKNYGLGTTFKTELEKALERKADVIVHIDADGQYLPEEIPLLLKKLEEGADLALGSRFKGKIEGMPLIKRFGNRIFSLIVSYITKMPVSDAQTGFRAFTKKLAEEANITSSFTYTQDQIITISKKKFKIVEVPVTFLKREGKSRLMKSPLDYGIRGGANLVRLFRDYAPITFFGSIGMVFITAGLAIGSWLLYRFLTLGAIGKTPSLILTVLLIVIGLQFILFGFYADSRKR